MFDSRKSQHHRCGNKIQIFQPQNDDRCKQTCANKSQHSFTSIRVVGSTVLGYVRFWVCGPRNHTSARSGLTPSPGNGNRGSNKRFRLIFSGMVTQFDAPGFGRPKFVWVLGLKPKTRRGLAQVTCQFIKSDTIAQYLRVSLG
jgi:hypothetical protein